MGYKLEELSAEEGKALTADLQEVLAKHNAEMGVTSSIQLLKRVSDGKDDEPVVSPVQAKDLENGTENGNTEATA